MRRSLPLLLLASIAVVACNASDRYTLRFSEDIDAAKRTELTSAAVRVVEGWMSGIQKELGSYALDINGDEAELSLQLPDRETAEKLRERLTAPFEMRIMTKVDDGQGDISHETFGSFKETGLTEKHFAWAEATGGSVPGIGAVIMTFTPEGQQLLAAMFEQNKGKTIGIFVRGVLVSQKVVDETDTKHSLFIDGIPKMERARVFADDVNVGLHVEFVPGS